MEKQDIIQLIQIETAGSPKNNFAGLGLPQEKMWDCPLVGFAAGDDPIFAFFKEDIGEFFWSPAEAFKKQYPEAQVEDKDLTVVSAVFPQTEITKAEQRKQKTEPCLRWMYSRNEWGPFAVDLSRTLVEKLAAAGVRAASIDLIPDFAQHKSEKYDNASNWSQRHAAHAAGLGTFGLCDGLITPLGKAVRFATLILEAKIEPDPRPYKDHHAWCLFYAKGACNACINICPAGAIDKDGHHKKPCAQYLQRMAEKFKDRPELQPCREYGCGLCQGPVPCQNGIPAGIE